MNISEQDTAVEFIAQWSPVVKTNRCDQDRITLTHDYYQPITMAIEKIKRNYKYSYQNCWKSKKARIYTGCLQKNKWKGNDKYI